MKKLIGKYFKNAEKLSAKPALLRRLRACRIALAAAGIVGFTMERVASEPDEASEREEFETTDTDCCCGLFSVPSNVWCRSP